MIKAWILLSLSFLLVFEGCRTAPPPRKPVKTGARPPIGLPPAPQEIDDEPDQPLPPSAQQEEVFRPPPPQEKRRVAVILGPGGAKSFAHVGVLKALQQQRIPIEKVVGLEWGALIGGLFAIKGTVHDVEWKLYKMEQNNPLTQSKSFFSRSGPEHSLSVMDNFFNDVFGREEIAKARLPFACPSRSIYSGVVAWQKSGSFRDAVKRCLAFPPVFKAQGTFIAGASQATEAVELLVKEGYNVIILVNVLGSAMPVGQDALRDNLNYVILWQEVKRAIYETSRLNIDTINVDTSSVPMTNFAAKKDLISLGETAGARAANGLIVKYGF
jgi:NTE family protein